MPGSLVLIEETTVSSAVSSVTLGGANWDTSYNVYKVVVNNVVTDTDGQPLIFRHLDSSNNPITTANYDVAFLILRTDTSFEDAYGTGNTFHFISDHNIGTQTGEVANAVLYLFNSNNASEYTFHTVESSYRNNTGVLRGAQGGGVLDSAVVTKGISLFMNSGNITAGTFKLYGLKK
tara:strand:- start:15 stop:545 length:531 start_codon:yes stop_codon:yes gene_type:complete